jgi:disulfide bond formation protein DsbB
MGNLQRYLNVVWVLIVCSSLFIANWFQFVEDLRPCYFCLFQRVALAGMGLCAIMNLRFGPRIEHYSCSSLFILLGLMVSYRLNPFGPSFFGYQLSSWSSMVFIGSIVGESVLLLLYSQTKLHDVHSRWGKLEKSLSLILALLFIFNISL